jgi:hypothetical protein
MFKVTPKNRLVNSPAYPKILYSYNERMKEKGKVNDKLFYEEVVSNEVANYSLQAWYQFLHRFKTEKGLIELRCAGPKDVLDNTGDAETALVTTMLSNQEATASLIQTALNISATAAKKIAEDPSLLTEKERLEIGLKAMKAQDSRIHAIKSIREDGREAAKFDRAFDNAAY